MANGNGNGTLAYKIIIGGLITLLMLFVTGFVDDLKGETDTEKRIATLEAKVEYMETNVVKRLDRLEGKIDRLIEGR